MHAAIPDRARLVVRRARPGLRGAAWDEARAVASSGGDGRAELLATFVHRNARFPNRWVEPLTDSILRVIVVNLSNSLESTRVYKIPRRNKAGIATVRV